MSNNEEIVPRKSTYQCAIKGVVYTVEAVSAVIASQIAVKKAVKDKVLTSIPTPYKSGFYPGVAITEVS